MKSRNKIAALLTVASVAVLAALPALAQTSTEGTLSAYSSEGSDHVAASYSGDAAKATYELLAKTNAPADSTLVDCHQITVSGIACSASRRNATQAYSYRCSFLVEETGIAADHHPVLCAIQGGIGVSN